MALLATELPKSDKQLIFEGNNPGSGKSCELFKGVVSRKFSIFNDSLHLSAYFSSPKILNSNVQPFEFP
jgi:hypothetical protein